MKSIDAFGTLLLNAGSFGLLGFGYGYLANRTTQAGWLLAELLGGIGLALTSWTLEPSSSAGKIATKVIGIGGMALFGHALIRGIRGYNPLEGVSTAKLQGELSRRANDGEPQQLQADSQGGDGGTLQQQVQQAADQVTSVL